MLKLKKKLKVLNAVLFCCIFVFQSSHFSGSFTCVHNTLYMRTCRCNECEVAQFLFNH